MDTTAIFEFLRSRAKFAVAAAGLFEIRGPTPCPTEKIQDNYRFHVWYFCENVVRASARLTELRAAFPQPEDVIDVIDVDPIDVG